MSYNIEFLNSNSLRSYPLKEDTDLYYGDQMIPNDLLVDAMFTMAATTDVLSSSFKIYLTRLIKTSTHISLWFTDNSDEGNSLGTVDINIAEHKQYDVYYLSKLADIYEDSVIKIVVGNLKDIALPSGDYKFKAELSPHVIRPALRGVRSLQVQDGVSISDRIYGHIQLIAGDNIKLSYNSEANSITISAIDGTNTIQECECEDPYPELKCIKTINNISPDATGNIDLVGLECLDISSASAVITIQDVCAVPCCGCDELTKIANSLTVVNSNINSLASNMDRLSARQQSFYDTVLLYIEQ